MDRQIDFGKAPVEKAANTPRRRWKEQGVYTGEEHDASTALGHAVTYSNTHMYINTNMYIQPASKQTHVSISSAFFLAFLLFCCFPYT